MIMGTIRQKIANAIYPEAFHERRQLEQLAFEDRLTGLGNRHAYEIAIERIKDDPNMEVIVFDINNLGLVNKQYGHKEGDARIVWASEVIMMVTSAQISPRFCFRTGGDEFVIISPKHLVESIIRDVEGIHGGIQYDGFVVSIGGSAGKTFDDADRNLQMHKHEVKQRYLKAA